MSRTGPWTQLNSALLKERNTYRQLSHLLTEEWTALKAMDHHRVVDLTHQKERLLSLITQYEQERNSYLRKLAGPLFQGDLLKWLSQSRAPQAKVAQQTLDELVSVGERVKHMGENNSGLTVRALHVVRETIGLIRTGLGAQPVYGESGQLRFPSVTSCVNLQG